MSCHVTSCQDVYNITWHGFVNYVKEWHNRTLNDMTWHRPWDALWHGIAGHIIACHVMARFDMVKHGMVCYGMICHAMPCHAMPCHAMPCHAMPCHAMPCHAMPCHAMPCHAMPCHAMPCNRKTSSHGRLWCDMALWHDTGYRPAVCLSVKPPALVTQDAPISPSCQLNLNDVLIVGQHHQR